MSLRNVGIVYRKELTDSLRDRRTLVSMIVIPLLLFPVMIFDEPTLGLDVMTARTIVGFIRECRQNGKTVIFSTHVMSEAEKLCDTIGIIHNGRILAEGTLAELRQRYGEQDLEEIFVRVVTN